MYAIIDARCSEEIKISLSKYVDDIFEFSSNNVTYNAISGHPDIFVFQDAKKLIIAPNTPKELIEFFNNKKIKYLFGKNKVGTSLLNSSLYNCFCTKDYFFSKKGIPDHSIVDYCAEKQLIKLSQGYVRCGMFALDNTKMVTSDLGIVKSLKNNDIDYFYFDPSGISIIDYKNGFVGGTMGKINNKIFFLGNLLKHKNGAALHNYIMASQQEVICLGKDYLYDGGGIFFVE